MPKNKKKCKTCGLKHLPPTGAKCTFFPFDEHRDSDKEIGDIGFPAGWADSETEAYSQDSPRDGFDCNSEISFPRLHKPLHPPQFLPLDPIWPVKKEGKSPVDATMKRADDGPPSTRRASYHPEGRLEKNQGKSELGFQVFRMQTEMEKLFIESHENKNKLSRIEELLERAVGDRDRAWEPARPTPPQGDSGQRHDPQLPRQQGGQREMIRGRPSSRDKFHDRKRHSRQDSSDSKSSSSSTSRSSRDKDRHKKDNDSSKKKHKFKIARFLPTEEHEKLFTTDRLWFCHGSLMLECYRDGEDIEGMLLHNKFISEKAASRAYLSSGIVKYDEGVREQAKDVGLAAYSDGNMGLALRFLSREYARPRSGQSQGSGRGGIRKPPYQSNYGGREIKGFGTNRTCWLYNSSGCFFYSCKFAHVCSKCGGTGHGQQSCRQQANVSSQSANVISGY